MGNKQMSADEAAVAAADERFGKGGGGMPSSQMGAEGGLSTKAPGKPITKAEDEEEEDEEKEEGEDLEKEKAAKSEAASVDADDLMKAMDALEATADGIGGEPDRRSELAEKVADGTISKAERAELFELLGGPEEEGEGEDLGKSFSEIFATDKQMAQDYEVAPFIERHSQLVADALDSMRENLTKSTVEQQVFNRALAKSFKGIGKVIADQQVMIKGLSDQNSVLAERLGVVEKTPNPRKGLTGAKPMQKSFAGGEPAAGGLNEEQITEGLNRLMVKSRENNFLAPCGEPIDRAVTLYETERKITRGMLGDVAGEMGVALQLQ